MSPRREYAHSLKPQPQQKTEVDPLCYIDNLYTKLFDGN
jgi:hypothetical protein